MAIVKASAGNLHDLDLAYAVVPSDVIRGLKGDALAIYVHLINKPAEWIPRPKEIMRELAMGRRRYRAGKAELESAGLATDEVIRDESGKITDRILTIYALPTNHFTVETGMCPTGTVATAFRRTEKPSYGECAPIDKTEVLKKTDVIDGEEDIFSAVFQKTPSEGKKSTRERTIQEDLEDTSWAYEP